MEEISKVEPAIIARGVSKQYVAGTKILDYLDMTVIKGKIYGLLGSSGCGKTTLLSGIVGTRKIDGGVISILGKAPGVVPIKSIGYMPQDIALVGELSIKNVLQHQGWIFGMTTKEIEEKHKFYEKLLDLPPGNRLIKDLSGGQQRRVSLAVVLIQDPELLILDEPTVGLDPMLRQNLWDYLTKITKEEKKTVMITTHYIEEARQADMVGMLRNGKMLAEGEPQNLMNEFNCSSLEDLFITLSIKQEQRDLNVINSQHQNRLIPRFDELKILNQSAPKRSKTCFMNIGHAKALLSKNFIRYVNHRGTLIVAIFLPIIQITTLFTAIGGIPSDLKVGIVNEELGEYRNCEDYLNDNQNVGGSPVDENGTCVYNGLGCKFVQHFHEIIPNQIYYESLEEALKDVRKGKIHHLLFFSHNYSESVTVVNDFVRGAFDQNLDSRDIVVYRDEADYTLGLHVERQLFKSYEKFAKDLATECKWGENFGKLPMNFNDPIYGVTDPSYTDFITPGIMTLTVLILAKSLAAHTIISERMGGVWERMMVSGVTSTEIVLCHIITMSFISAFQTIEIFLLSYYVFGFECKGNVSYMLLLLFLQGIIGITLGMLLSVISKTETAALYGALGISFPFLLITGFFWPLEGIPWFLRYISYSLPPTIPIEAMSSIIFRGWGITNFHVYKAFLSSIAYSCFFTFVSAILLKFEKK